MKYSNDNCRSCNHMRRDHYELSGICQCSDPYGDECRCDKFLEPMFETAWPDEYEMMGFGDLTKLLEVIVEKIQGLESHVYCDVTDPKG